MGCQSINYASICNYGSTRNYDGIGNQLLTARRF
jgi:hypothetical protein